jgi:hypothetical protein
LLAKQSEIIASISAAAMRGHETHAITEAGGDVDLHSAAESTHPAETHSKRQRMTQSSWLNDNGNLLKIFQHIGKREHLYVASLARRWRTRYLAFTGWTKKTSFRAALVTVARLDAAFQHGLTLTLLQGGHEDAGRLDECSYDVLTGIEPIAVISELRVRGMQWDSFFVWAAVAKGDLRTLAWLGQKGCSFGNVGDYLDDVPFGRLDILKCVARYSGQWDQATIGHTLQIAARHGDIVKLQYFMGLSQAMWPQQFCSTYNPWCLTAVQWATENGSGWRRWRCQDWHEVYKKYKEQADAVFKWAHEHGCPCTCDEEEL